MPVDRVTRAPVSSGSGRIYPILEANMATPRKQGQVTVNLDDRLVMKAKSAALVRSRLTNRRVTCRI